MNVHRVAQAKDLPPAETRRASVVEILPSGEIGVHLGAQPGEVILCDFLDTTRADPPLLRRGDQVLVLVPRDQGEKPVILGKIGTYRAPDRKRVVLDAEEELTIRCGEATIVIRKSGKILIKGVDIVTHARQQNRIRGGSIQIN